MNGSPQRIYRVEDIEVDTSQGCLRRDGQEQHLRHQTLQVLLHLLEQRHRLVSKEELFDTIWKDTAVTDDALAKCVMEIRKALGDDFHHPRLLKTIPKSGYRFIGQVEQLCPDGPTVIETEEITSVEVEFKEEITNGTRGHRDTSTRRIALPLRVTTSPRTRVILPAVLLTILVAVPSLVYIGKKMRHSSRPLAEVTLEQVPGKKPLVVMYFDNQSESRDLDWLREGLADMFIADLSRSQKLTVLSRQQLYVLLERSGHDQDERIRLEQALDIARRSQATAVVLGSFARLNEKIRIDVQLYDARAGQLLATDGLVADRADQILAQVELLSLKLASHLGVAAEQTKQTSMADVMTDNLEAYRYYSLALEKAEAVHNTEAIALLEKAIALDHEFAMAYARIGYTYAVTGGLAEKGRPYLEKAFRLPHRLSEKDRLYISAWYAIANLDFQGAIRSFQEIVKQYPLESEAYVKLGKLLSGEERHEEAIAMLKQGLVSDPEFKDIYNILGGVYEVLGKHDEAVAAKQRYVALAPDEPNAYDSLGLAYQSVGQYDLAAAEYNRALALNPKFEVAMVHLANVYAQLGEYRRAINQYQLYIQTAPADMFRARGYHNIAVVYWKRGEWDRAKAAAKTATRYDKSYVLPPLSIAVEQGDLTRTEKLKEGLALWPYTYRGAKLPMRFLSYYDGRIAFKSGRAAAAIEKFKETLRHAPIYWDLDQFEDCLANAYLELGQFDEAIAEYERILGINPNYPLVRYHLGQAYERKGQPDRARAEYEQFLHIWNTADPDIPEIVAAKKRLAAES